MSEVAIQVDHVWKKFKKGESFDSLRDLIPAMTRRPFSRNLGGELRAREFWALKDVAFEVRRGEALGVIGPNGAGKSTILKLLSKILKPNKGSLRVQGRVSSLIEIGAGFHPDLTGRENVYLNGAILGMTRDEIKRKFDAIVDFSGIGDFIDTPVKRYSSGMYARLGFSVAAHVDPDILLVDEVLSVGDMKFQEKCLDKMLSFAKGGHTVVFVSHNLAAVNTLCPKTALMTKGELARLGATSDVLTDYVRLVHSGEETTETDQPIRNIRLVNCSQEQATRFAPGEAAALTFSVRGGLPLGDCLLGFIIRRATDNLPVCDYNLSMDVAGAQVDRDGGIELKVIFRVNLLRGAYIIQLHIHHGASGMFLARVNPAAFFSVEERVSYEGVSHLEPLLVTGDR